ncbi:MAG TPA: PIG-L family deacetylase [Vicinamibacterales bacterium]|nr:PIG-L family deacetylase [Vicinamibacterales bacterium]
MLIRLTITRRLWLLLVGAAAVLAAGAPLRSAPPSQDEGAAGTWQMLLKLQTTASAMHTTAHPDDEHGGVLAMLSRRDGARLALLTLNRGESGDNAIGPQLFDGLGLIRTEELLISNQFYGVDDQYFTTVIDYGFSKRLEEAFEKWGREQVLRDVVRIIRMNRPYVLISRFQGNERDGHGNHQTAGLISQLAFKAAGDPSMFPEQMREGLRPWQPLKLYIGGVREDEGWSLRVDPGEFSPWIGDSYSNFARLGLSFQRSQTGGRFNSQPGPAPGYYTRLAPSVTANTKEAGFFDGIDTSLPGLFKTLGKPEPSGAAPLLTAIDSAVKKAVAAFTIKDSSTTVPALAEGLTATRAALAALGDRDPDVRFVLEVKERQFQEAINIALAVDLTALAQPSGVQDPTGPFAQFAPPPTMAAPVPGQTFEIRTRVTNRGNLPITPSDIGLVTDPGWGVRKEATTMAQLTPNASVVQRFTVTLAGDVPLSSRPYFCRASIQDARYTLSDPTQFGRAAATPPATAVVRYTVAGVAVEKRPVVRRRESKLPYGDVLRELRVVPALSVRVAPEHAVLPLQVATKQVALTVDLLNNHQGAISGQLALTLPPAWRAEPATQPFAFERPGERRTFPFTVTLPALETRAYTITAVATANGVRYAEGYELIDQRDLEVRYLYRPSTVQVRGLDVTVVPRLNVGYVMGVGDQVPAGIAQLGYPVTLLGESDLATGTLERFDTILTGTRAYAVRDDLRTYHRRLLDYVRQGGNLVVLYNTQELIPARFAPFPAEHGPRAEEVSEEDAAVRILAPAAQALTWPNRITASDFEGWVEQRGSKFWAAWDPAYTAMIETADQGQAPQRGGWLQASYGKGTYTYFAYAFHRQLPYGVPGAYRLLANVLALGKTPPPGR